MPMMQSNVKEVTPDRSGVTQAALSVLERHGGKRGRQALTLAAAAQVVWPTIQWAWKRLHREKDFTITVDGEDGVYADLHGWVLARIPEQNRRALLLSTSVGRLHEEGEDRLRLYYDGSREQDVTIDGHKLWVKVEKEDLSSLGERRRHVLDKIVFTASSAAGRDAILRLIDGLVATKQGDSRPPLMVPSRWGGQWNRRGDLPERTLDSVILKAGQLERLVADLEVFLASEGQYARVFQPWHRGYLFHGIPGTGKTSVARALANHFGMSIYYLPLGDLDGDADLMQLVTQVEPRSMLLLEDVDTNHAATERDDTKGRTSVAGLLNALDGIWTPHGLVTVLTTNHRDALDEALLREGRVDIDEEFTAMDEDQVCRLAGWFGFPVEDPEEYVGESPAALIEQLRNTRNTRQEVAA